jgi:arylsulfatase A-like enzyme
MPVVISDRLVKRGLTFWITYPKIMTLSRRRFVFGSAAALAGKRPNFIVLLTDDQRFDTVRALWGGQVLTPHMDRLVRRGVAFTNACTQGGLTGAICMPSRAQLLTGRSVFRVHQGIVERQERPDPEMVTFPETLRRAGYQTFATGKWHNGAALFQRSFESGDNIFFGGMGDQIQLPVQPYDASGKYPKERVRPAGKFSSELFSDTAVRFLRERDRSKPYLLYVAYTSPHDPRMAPARYADLFPPSGLKLPKNFLPQHPFDNGEMKVRDEMLAGFPRTEDEIRKHLAGYYAMIAEVDAQIGRVLDAIDDDNTYVIFAGDNGLAVGQHGLMGKQNHVRPQPARPAHHQRTGGAKRPSSSDAMPPDGCVSDRCRVSGSGDER